MGKDKMITPEFISAMELIIKGFEETKIDFNKIESVDMRGKMEDCCCDACTCDSECTCGCDCACHSK